MMIENKRQYLATKAQVEKFAQSLAVVKQEPGRADGMHPTLRKAEADALQSQRESLQEEMRDYGNSG